MEAMFLTAIVIEIRSLCFYRTTSLKVSDSRTRLLFEMLALDKSEHLKSFCSHYPGNSHELVDILIKNNLYAYPYFCSMLNSTDCGSTEKNALRIALNDEQASIECYAGFVETIREPPTRDIFKRILIKTRKHFERLDMEYMRIMDTVDQDGHVNNRRHMSQYLNN